MFLKVNSFFSRFLFLAIVLYSIWPISFVAADSGVRIEMKRATHKNVRVAVTQFDLRKGGVDSEKLGLEAYEILANDLKLSEMFLQIAPNVYKNLEQKEMGGKEVDLWAWHQLGAQWLVKTEYSVMPDGKLSLTFRLYDTVSEKFLLGKRYSVTEKKFLRKVIHRYADELVFQLTGKRGVAETQIAFLSRDNKNTEIFSVDFDGYNSKKITDDNTLNLTPAWSPNGRWLIYTSYAGNNPDLIMIDIT